MNPHFFAIMVASCLELQPFVFLSRWDKVQIDAFPYNIQDEKPKHGVIGIIGIGIRLGYKWLKVATCDWNNENKWSKLVVLGTMLVNSGQKWQQVGKERGERESKKFIDHNVTDNDQLQTKEHSLQGAQPKCGP